MWTPAGKTMIITGATSGIGLEAAVALARLGARVVLIGRNPKRIEGALSEVRTRAGADAASYLCDFSSQASIRDLAGSLLRNYPQIEVLVNNAGGVHKQRSLSADGIEATFATNHLGYFLLTNLLLDRLIASAPSRVVTVASGGHRGATLNFDDLGYEQGYTTLNAYRRSKLANILFASELARRLEGRGVTSNSLSPGPVATNIWSGVRFWAKPIIAVLARTVFITAEAGGAKVVHMAASPDLEGVSGRYFENRQPASPSLLAQDETLGRRLWDVSERLVGLA